jgi:chromosome segregation ATPase
MTPTLNERVTVLEHRMDEQERLRASQDHDLSSLSENIRAQKSLLQALADTQSEHTRALGNLSRDVSVLKTDMSVVKRDVSELKGDVSELKGDVSELKGDVAGLKGDVAGLKGDVAELKGGLAEINGKIDMLIERGGRS